MLFAKIARTIIRRHRLVFVVWIAAFLISIPAFLQVQNVIVYTETAFNPKDSESSRAQEIVAREFSIDEGSSAIVVIASSDVRGNNTRDFTLALNKTLHQDPSLTNISNITSIYDIYYQLIYGFTSVVHFQLYQLKNATDTAAFLEYGIPDVYVSEWSNFVRTGPQNLNGADIAQYNRQANATSWVLISSQTPQAYLPIAASYHQLFFSSWNATFDPSGVYDKTDLLSLNSPLFRAQNVTKGFPGLPVQPPYYNITYPYYQSLPLDNTTRRLFLSAAVYFNLYPVCATCNNWNDPATIKSFVVGTLAQVLNPTPAQLSLMGQIYDFGPSTSPVSYAAMGNQFLGTNNILTYPLHPSRAVYTQFISASNDTMLVILDFRSGGPDPRNSVQQIRADVTAVLSSIGQEVTVYVTGAPAFNYDIETETVKDVERIDPVTVLLIMVIIGLFFRSFSAPLVPVSAIGLSVGLSFALVYVIGALVTSIHFLVLTLLPVAMFGAGSDYCIFIISRYAEERRAGHSKLEAVEHAATWAGESIATSGATVVIAFGSLAVASFGMLRSIGIAVMLGISIALLVSLTLVPATLAFFGDRVFWPRGLKAQTKSTGGDSYYRRAAKLTARHSKLILLLALVVSVPAASAVISSATSHDFIAQIPDSLESKAGYNVMSTGFGPGSVTPTYTLVETPAMLVADNWINITALGAISYAENSTLAISGVSKVYGLTHPAGEPIPYFSFNQLNIAEQQQMIRSMKPFLGQSGKSAMVWAVLANEPFSDEAIKTVEKIRGNISNLRSDPLLSSSTLLVGGATASVADLAAAGARDYVNLTLIVLVGVFLVLMMALGSVFTPLRLIFTILLSVSWAMATVLLVSENIMGSQVIWMMPIMLLVIMVGLGLDYDIFLVTRIREYVAGGSKDEEAIESAVEHTGGVITASGLVTAGAFGTMMLSRIPMLQQLGLAIATVVLLDATLIRIYLVPSIMRHMKRLNWWAPGPLRRVPAIPEPKIAPKIQ